MPSPVDHLRSRASLRTKRRIALRRLQLRSWTAGRRALPGLLIIGAQRCGTSSLYRYLGAHPQVVRSIRKETEYLTRSFDLGERWYRSHFTLRTDRLAFEATPDYLMHPLAAGRAAALLPDARLIVLLRDPAERAVSHHRHMVRLGYEPLGLADALDAEAERIGDAVERLEGGGPVADVRPLLRYSYAARGRYGEQLARWMAVFDRSRLLVLRSDDLYRSPGHVLEQVEAFLGLRPWQPATFPNHSLAAPSAGPLAPADARALERLRASLEPDGRQLRALLGDGWRWDGG